MRIKNIIFFVISVIMLFPMLWMFLLSIKSNAGQVTSILEFFSGGFSIRNYYDIFNSNNFFNLILNSVFVSSVVTILNIIFCLLVAYVLARKTNKINKLIFISTLSVLIIPPHIIMIPLYRLMVNFGWIDTYYALILPWAITPFGIFLLKQYIEKIPLELEDAAKIDGASEFYILLKVILPMCKPVIIVLTIYTFLGNWNSFLFPFLFTNSENMFTLPVGLTFFFGKQSIDWGQLMAGASIAAIPMIALYLVFKKQIVQGMLYGALKE